MQVSKRWFERRENNRLRARLSHSDRREFLLQCVVLSVLAFKLGGHVELAG